MHKIGLIDYGMGNIHSVTKSLESLGEEIILLKNFKESKSCKAIILPGVGAFDPAMINLIKTDLINDLKNWINSGKSFLGICLGLQLLFESSDEGEVQGLGILKGKIQKIPYRTKKHSQKQKTDNVKPKKHSQQQKKAMQNQKGTAKNQKRQWKTREP